MIAQLEYLRSKWVKSYYREDDDKVSIFLIAFTASFYESLMNVKEWQWWNQRETNLDEFKASVQKTIVYFCLLPTLNFRGSYSMVESFYRSYSIFTTQQLIETLINSTNYYHDDSQEARVGLLFAIYENETGEDPISLLQSFES